MAFLWVPLQWAKLLAAETGAPLMVNQDYQRKLTLATYICSHMMFVKLVVFEGGNFLLKSCFSIVNMDALSRHKKEAK